MNDEQNPTHADGSPVYLNEPTAAQNQYYGVTDNNIGYANMASGTDLGKHTTFTWADNFEHRTFSLHIPDLVLTLVLFL
jgi:hypothetical protein